MGNKTSKVTTIKSSDTSEIPPVTPAVTPPVTPPVKKNSSFAFLNKIPSWAQILIIIVIFAAVGFLCYYIYTSLTGGSAPPVPSGCDISSGEIMHTECPTPICGPQCGVGVLFNCATLQCDSCAAGTTLCGTGNSASCCPVNNCITNATLGSAFCCANPCGANATSAGVCCGVGELCNAVGQCEIMCGSLNCPEGNECVVLSNLSQTASNSLMKNLGLTQTNYTYNPATQAAVYCAPHANPNCEFTNPIAAPPIIDNFYPAYMVFNTNSSAGTAGIGFCATTITGNSTSASVSYCASIGSSSLCNNDNTNNGCYWFDLAQQVMADNTTTMTTIQNVMTQTFGTPFGYWARNANNNNYVRAIKSTGLSGCGPQDCINQFINYNAVDIYYDASTNVCVALQNASGSQVPSMATSQNTTAPAALAKALANLNALPLLGTQAVTSTYPWDSTAVVLMAQPSGLITYPTLSGWQADKTSMSPSCTLVQSTNGTLSSGLYATEADCWAYLVSSDTATQSSMCLVNYRPRLFFDKNVGNVYVGCFYYGNPVSIPSSQVGPSGTHPEFTTAMEDIECNNCSSDGGSDANMHSWYYLTGPGNSSNYTSTNKFGTPSKAPSGQEVLTHFVCTYSSPADFNSNGGNTTSPLQYKGTNASFSAPSTLASVSGNIFNTNHNGNGKGYNSFQNWAPYILQSPDDKNNCIPYDGCSKVVDIDANGNINVNEKSQGDSSGLTFLYNNACFIADASGSVSSSNSTAATGINSASNIPGQAGVVQIKDATNNDSGINLWNIFNLDGHISQAKINSTSIQLTSMKTLKGISTTFDPTSPKTAQTSFVVPLSSSL